jgi:hypothetical protein
VFDDLCHHRAWCNIAAAALPAYLSVQVPSSSPAKASVSINVQLFDSSPVPNSIAASVSSGAVGVSSGGVVLYVNACNSTQCSSAVQAPGPASYTWTAAVVNGTGSLFIADNDPAACDPTATPCTFFVGVYPAAGCVGSCETDFAVQFVVHDGSDLRTILLSQVCVCVSVRVCVRALSCVSLGVCCSVAALLCVVCSRLLSCCALAACKRVVVASLFSCRGLTLTVAHRRVPCASKPRC